MNRGRADPFGQQHDVAHALEQRVGRQTADLAGQLLGGKRKRRRIDVEIDHAREGGGAHVAGGRLAVEPLNHAEHVAAHGLVERAAAGLDLDFAFENEAKRPARLALPHQHRGRRQFAPVRQAQQLPNIDVVELAQQRQAANRLPARLIGHHLVFFQNLVTHCRQILGHVGAEVVARIQILLHRARNHLVGQLGDVRVELGHRHRFHVDDLVNQRGSAGSAKRQPAGEQLIKHHAE